MIEISFLSFVLEISIRASSDCVDCAMCREIVVFVVKARVAIKVEVVVT
jgi:hypothetical protein